MKPSRSVSLPLSRRTLWHLFFTALFLAICVAIACAAQQPTAAHASHLRAPDELQCNGQSHPLAIDSPRPDLSWQLHATSVALHDVNQTAYQIQVAGAGQSFAHSPLWDSGIVHSAEISGIAYAGPALQPQQAYAWRVRVWDGHGHASPWSAAAGWLQAPEWHAQWIQAPGATAKDNTQPMPLFRKAFTLPHTIKRAILYSSGLGQDELHLNGRKVGDDLLTPGWSNYRKTVYYDAYDVTRMLRPGANALGILLGNGMYRVLHTKGRYTKFVGSFGPLKCIVQLHIEFEGGGSTDIVSDATWKTHPGPITFSSTYGGEDYDARLDPRGWDQPGFNDAAWSATTPTDGPGGALLPELAPPIRMMHVYAPIHITHPKPGVTVYDFGQNFAGWPSISVSGPASATVKLIPGELLDASGLVTQRSSGRPQWFSYTLRGTGIEQWHPRFAYYGFRYLQVEGASGQSGVRLLSVRGDAVHTSSEQIGSFSSSSSLLNRIHILILRAIENNAVSLFTDCPHREKLGWLEETHLMAPSMIYDFNFAGLYAATARNIADAQATSGPKAGMVPEIAPQYVVFTPQTNDVFNDSPEWGSAAVLAPWYLYQRTGDKQFLDAQYAVMRRYVSYLATRAHNGIISYGLGDWYDIGPGGPGFSKLTSPGVTATAIDYQDLTVLAKTAAILGRDSESKDYAQQAAAVRSAFNARFFHAAQHSYDKGSQTAQAMPLVLGMVSEDQPAAVLATLVADIRAHQNHTTAGDIGYHYVVDALLQGGRTDVLLSMLERTDSPSYGYQLAQGATSLTEAWDANPQSSQDHFMLGDAEEGLYRGLGGINLDLARQGAAQLVLSPAVLPGLTWVHTQYRSAIGLIQSDWRRGAQQTAYTFDIPVNATATLKLDTASAQSVTLNGVAAPRAAGVLATHIDGSHLQIIVGSGHYVVRAANPPAA